MGSGKYRRAKKTTKNKEHRRNMKHKHGLRGDDLIYQDLKPENQEKLLNQPVNEDLPGLGQFYCITCAKYFQNQAAIDEHNKTKKHKNAVRRLKEKPYDHEEAEIVFPKVFGAISSVRPSKLLWNKTVNIKNHFFNKKKEESSDSKQNNSNIKKNEEKNSECEIVYNPSIALSNLVEIQKKEQKLENDSSVIANESIQNNKQREINVDNQEKNEIKQQPQVEMQQEVDEQQQYNSTPICNLQLEDNDIYQETQVNQENSNECDIYSNYNQPIQTKNENNKQNFEQSKEEEDDKNLEIQQKQESYINIVPIREIKQENSYKSQLSYLDDEVYRICRGL